MKRGESEIVVKRRAEKVEGRSVDGWC